MGGPGPEFPQIIAFLFYLCFRCFFGFGIQSPPSAPQWRPPLYTRARNAVFQGIGMPFQTRDSSVEALLKFIDVPARMSFQNKGFQVGIPLSGIYF